MSAQLTNSKISANDSAAYSFINSVESNWKGHLSFVFWLVKYLKPKIVMDLGFDRGLSTIAFGFKNKGKVFGIDWFDKGDYIEKCFALDSASRNISNAIRFHYIKNVHLTIGPFEEVLKKWKANIDILHIDGAFTYDAIKYYYESWIPYLNQNGVVLIHGIESFPNEVGRFFKEIKLFKTILTKEKGLAIASKDHALIKKITEAFDVV